MLSHLYKWQCFISWEDHRRQYFSSFYPVMYSPLIEFIQQGIYVKRNSVSSRQFARVIYFLLNNGGGMLSYLNDFSHWKSFKTKKKTKIPGRHWPSWREGWELERFRWLLQHLFHAQNGIIVLKRSEK